MTPEQASAHAALLLISRLIHLRGLTVEEAVTAVAQQRRKETGPHAHLVAAEASAVVTEAAAPIRAFVDALRPAAEGAAAAMAELGRALQPADRAAGGRRDRPSWSSPYGPPPRRRLP